ncbi:MAG TPA: NUDIX hydrolase [Longimicrobiaceae bacterium]|nr:NUDIX hydrolase [Longimicrobiaceae bacterium]
MSVRLRDRRRRSSKGRQIWRHLRTAMRLLLRHPVPSVSVVPVLADGRIVLVRRVDDDRWAIPGGMMDWGEDVPGTAERELEEETGLRIVTIRRLLGVYSSPERDPRTHAVNVTVVAEVEGEPEIQDALEVSDVQAFPIERLPFGYLAHDHERQLRDYLDDRTVVA